MIFEDPSQRRKKRLFISLSVFVLTILVLAANLVYGYYRGRPAAAESSSNLRYFAPIREKTLTLTFDDGPNPEHTPAILETLRRHNVQATFFLVGENVRRYPELVRAIHAGGHEIGNHTYSHSLDVHSSARRLLWELGLTSDLVESITGISPAYYRAPSLMDMGAMIGVDPEPENAPLAWAYHRSGRERTRASRLGVDRAHA
jgi:peptidoglycan/xylan/chitin deacetylase (PgdA/CDA1 family)